MAPALERLRALIRHPGTQLATGVMLVVSGGIEIWSDFQSTEHSFHWGTHHGVALFGLIQILGSLPGLIDGIDRSLSAMRRKTSQIASNRPQPGKAVK